jgi:hypothetical protein
MHFLCAHPGAIDLFYITFRIVAHLNPLARPGLKHLAKLLRERRVSEYNALKFGLHCREQLWVALREYKHLACLPTIRFFVKARFDGFIDMLALLNGDFAQLMRGAVGSAGEKRGECCNGSGGQGSGVHTGLLLDAGATYSARCGSKTVTWRSYLNSSIHWFWRQGKLHRQLFSQFIGC